ncbi:methyl-accepting chemotaxis sensory transducer [Liquorilactobacillus mali KCTC 3596 = DSM 20444]|uniref:methyl-accepting chemotaxis protein n=1 Tax=Liquorilactobacillus mali TaxID=1618 RepID=UPI00026BD91C|nr:methyl-accepting chemotaxis protein [Liquorilactobacillus mali]EJF01286.1 methyl-accepting chemotaxis sensory transducer [Liquorilactobacillus mali KCTC 3596 = DSM 20444]
MKNKTSIGTIMAAVLIVAVMIPALVITTSSYIQTKNLLISRNDISKKSATNVLITSKQNLQAKVEQELKNLAYLQIFKSKFNDENINHTLKAIKSGNGDIKKITFASSKSSKSILNKGWYKGGLKNSGGIYWTAPYKDSEGDYIATASISIHNNEGQSGVLAMDTSYTGIQNTAMGIKVGRTGSATLISNSGRVVATNDISKSDGLQLGQNINKTELYKKIKQSKKMRGTLSIKGSNKIDEIYFDKVTSDSSTWVFSKVGKADLNKELNSLIMTAIWVIAITLVIVVIFSLIVSKMMSILVKQLSEYFIKAGRGELTIISTKAAKNSSWLNRIVHRILKPNEKGNEISRITALYNKMITSISELIDQVKEETRIVAQKSSLLMGLGNQTNKATEEVAQTITGIAEVTGVQAQETENSVTKLQKLSHITNGLSGNVEQMTKDSKEAAKLNEDNIKVSKDVEQNWKNELDKMEKLNQTVDSLDENIQNINKIISVINGVSHQTNLLALNASIEAASVGEEGKGFAVVATEIRKLSEKTKNSTKEIEEIIQKITKQSADMVSQTAASVAGGQKQTELIENAIDSSQEVFKKSSKLLGKIIEVEEYSKKIKEVQKDVLEKLEGVASSTEENAAGTEEVSANSEEVLATMVEFTRNIADLKEVSEVLEHGTEKFKTVK